jgi:hypothetical protein
LVDFQVEFTGHGQQVIEYVRLHPLVVDPGLVAAERVDLQRKSMLDQANITERVLLPGLDGLSQWLTRHYSPKKIL